MKVFVNFTKEDVPYQGQLVEILSQYGLEAKGSTKTHDTVELIGIARKLNAEAILVLNPLTLKNIVNDPKPSLMDWRGSVLPTSIPIVITNPLLHIKKTTTGKTLTHIDAKKLKNAPYINKFLYDYTICHIEEALIEAKHKLRMAAVLTVDIETNFHNQITSISFTPISIFGKIETTFVISLLPSFYTHESDLVLAWKVVKELCETGISKVFHNGVFDCFHLLRYHICVENYLWDTEYLWRAWHAELDKSLAKVCSYLLPDFLYWKHEAELSLLEYNAKDTINTARVFLHILYNAPQWVWINYAQLIPNVAPVLYTHFEGWLVDIDKKEEARQKAATEVNTELETLQEFIGSSTFNPGSPKQVSTLIYDILKAKKPARAKSESATGEVELKAVARQHPLFSLIVNKILKYRENKKAISTYYDAVLTENNRLLYSLNIDGTETTRMSCTASSLYTLKPGKKTYVKSNMGNLGTQLQNIPLYYKAALKADSGYLIGNVDKSQSEARCVGYLSKSKSLIEAIENPPEIAGVRDFYCYTGYKFFGFEFDKSHPLRQAVKKIIHGTNYLMYANTFIDSVSVEKLQLYKKLVGFRGSLFDFADKLLTLYHLTYPEVKEGWKEVVKEVSLTGKVVTPDGWTRIVEGDIVNDHSVLRSIVAHRPQHWSVWGINRAFWKLFYELQVPSKGEYRLKGQVHDSIAFQAKAEKIAYYMEETKRIMDIPQPCEYGIMRIPLDSTIGEYWK